VKEQFNQRQGKERPEALDAGDPEEEKCKEERKGDQEDE